MNVAVIMFCLAGKVLWEKNWIGLMAPRRKPKETETDVQLDNSENECPYYTSLPAFGINQLNTNEYYEWLLLLSWKWWWKWRK